MLRFLLSLLLACLVFTQTYAKERYVYRQISQKEGLTSTVNCIYKEKDGDVWIGSPSGLYRFNGYSLIQNEEPLLVGHSIYKVSLDNNGSLWVLTDSHLLRSRSDEEGFRKITIPSTDKKLPFYSLHHEEDCIGSAASASCSDILMMMTASVCFAKPSICLNSYSET